jgi:hypothetical protein
MKNGKSVLARFIFAAVALGAFASLGRAQAISHEEKLVRITYAKVMLYSRAGNIRKAVDNLTPRRPQNDITFSIRNVRTGPIEEIIDRAIGEMVTKPSGQIVEVTPALYSVNDGDQQLMYMTRWASARYSSMEDWENTSVRQVLKIKGNDASDIGMYTSYEVTVRLGGQERTYRAMALYHNQLQSTVEPRVEFLDNIISHTILTRTFLEKRAPFRARHLGARSDQLPASTTAFGPGQICDDAYPGWCCDPITMLCCFPFNPSNGICDEITCEYPNCNDPIPGDGGGGGGGCADPIVYGPSMSRMAADNRYHLAGQHKVESSLKGQCTYHSDCTLGCRVFDEYVRPSESGVVWSACHTYDHAIKYNDGSGQNNSVGCSTTVAVAFEACLFCWCQVEVSIGPAGIQSSGFWVYEHTLNHTCPAPTLADTSQ